MKYILLIHQGTTPTPRDPEAWGRLPEAEQQAVYADYRAVNETAGGHPGFGLGGPNARTPGPRAGRPDAHDRRPVRRDQGGARRLPDLRGRRPRRRDRARRADPGR